MAVTNTKSDLITKMDTAPVPLMAQTRVNGGFIEGQVGYATKASGDNTNSQYRMLRVHSSWRIAALLLTNPGWGTAGVAEIGLYNIAANGGLEVNASLFASAYNMSATANPAIDVNLEATATPAADMVKQVWERISGLTEDPNKYYDVVVSATNIGAASSAAFALQAFYQR